jgi:hypothetical protein
MEEVRAMDKDFTLSYDTTYDERDYREAEDNDNEDAEYDYVPPWEMEW